MSVRKRCVDGKLKLTAGFLGLRLKAVFYTRAVT